MYEYRATLLASICLLAATLSPALACDEVTEEHVHIMLYTRANPTDPIRLNDFNDTGALDPTKDIKMYVHAYIEPPVDVWIEALRDAVLQKGDYNFITVLYSKYATTDYITAVCYAPKVGRMAAQLIYRLNLDLDKLHVIGFSLGGQVSGFMGQEIQTLTGGKKIKRITGLDSAHGGFSNNDVDGRLSPEDAEFVDAIHTDANVYGFKTPYGHVDFWPNGGKSQVGCNETGSFYLICDHMRSVDYFIEGVNSDQFLATKCTNFEDFANGLCDGNEEIIMGVNCNATASGQYFLHTNPTSPYAQG